MDIEMRKPSVSAQEITEEEISRLLQCAHVPAPKTQAAQSWLRDALIQAQWFDPTKKLPLPADHNAALESVSRAAKNLAKKVKRLNSQPSTYGAFWRSVQPITTGIFDRSTMSDSESIELPHEPARRLDERDVQTILATIEQAAKTARDQRKGRPPARKQLVINLALGFFIQFSARKPSSTPSGSFAEFARAFYRAACKRDTDDELERQIRQAIERKRQTLVETAPLYAEPQQLTHISTQQRRRSKS